MCGCEDEMFLLPGRCWAQSPCGDKVSMSSPSFGLCGLQNRPLNVLWKKVQTVAMGKQQTIPLPQVAQRKRWCGEHWQAFPHLVFGGMSPLPPPFMWHSQPCWEIWLPGHGGEGEQGSEQLKYRAQSSAQAWCTAWLSHRLLLGRWGPEAFST